MVDRRVAGFALHVPDITTGLRHVGGMSGDIIPAP